MSTVPSISERLCIIPGSFVKMEDHGPQNIRRQLLQDLLNEVRKIQLIRESFVPY